MSSRVALAGSYREHPLHGAPAGEPASDEIVTVTVLLRRSKPAPDLNRLKWRLSYTELANLHGAHAADIEAVERFAFEQGLLVERVHAAARSVTLRGPLGAMTAAFGGDVRLSELNGQILRTRQGNLTVPSAIKDAVVAVLGLDERPVVSTNHRIQARATQPICYTPRQLAKIYNFPDNAGTGQTIAIIELGGGYRDADLASYWQRLGINAVSTTAISVDGAQNAPTGDLNGPDGEVVLDIEVAGGIAPGAQLAVYFAPNTDQGFLNAVNAAIHDEVRKPSVISISWGAPESGWTAQAMDAYDAAFHDAALLGISVCAAAGDNGSSDGVAVGNHVDFPASSPWVLACGGTRLIASETGIESETVWNDGTNRGATGGGVSLHFAKPGYQSHLNIPNADGSLLPSGRGVPDVAAVADPETGYAVLVDGFQTVVGGTSAVAPLWAGLIALSNEQLGRNLGWFHPALYSAAVQSKALRDITSGTNGAFEAGPGWDCCTGLGTPNGQAFLAAMKQSKR